MDGDIAPLRLKPGLRVAPQVKRRSLGSQTLYPKWLLLLARSRFLLSRPIDCRRTIVVVIFLVSLADEILPFQD